MDTGATGRHRTGCVIKGPLKITVTRPDDFFPQNLEHIPMLLDSLEYLNMARYLHAIPRDRRGEIGEEA